jgi:hypothetical protein
LAALTAVLALGLLCPEAAAEPIAPQIPEFKTIDPLLHERAGHALVRSELSGFKVLMAVGGYGNATLPFPLTPIFADANLYRPPDFLTSPIVQKVKEILTARAHHTATRLINGRALIAGGINILDNANHPGALWSTPATVEGNGVQYLNSAELYDPTTETASYTGNLNNARAYHTATLLANGQVLAAGGTDGSQLQTAELYNPATGIWSFSGDLKVARSSHTATRLHDGRVLVVAGFYQSTGPLQTAELYDPATGTWSFTGNLIGARTHHTATLLANGQVLVTGGWLVYTDPLKTAELYNPATGMWNATGDLNLARRDHTATLLPDGKVLVVGGWDKSGEVAPAELYDPGNGIWRVICSLNTSRYNHTAALWDDGKVIIMGGENSGGVLNSVELFYYGQPDLMGPLLLLMEN